MLAVVCTYILVCTHTTTRLQSEGLLENFNSGTHARRGLGLKESTQRAVWDVMEVQ